MRLISEARSQPTALALKFRTRRLGETGDATGQMWKPPWIDDASESLPVMYARWQDKSLKNMETTHRHGHRLPS